MSSRGLLAKRGAAGLQWLRHRGGFAFLAVALAITALVAWSMAIGADRELRGDLLHQAQTVASMIGVEHVAALTGTEADLFTVDYQHLKAVLMRVRLANPRFRFVYLMGQTAGGNVVFLVDSEAPDGSGYSPPGQVFAAGSERFLQAFTEEEEGTEGPSRDAWGTWVSAFVPLPGAHRGMSVVLGLDVAAAAWAWTVIGRAALPAGALAVALVLGLLSLRLTRANRAVRDREALLRESLKTSQDLVRAMPTGLYLYQLVPPGRLVLVDGNDEAERLTGLRTADLLGKDFDGTWPNARPEDLDDKCLAVLRSGQTFETESLRHVAQIEGVFRVRAFALPGQRLAVAFENVTERRRAEARVAQLLSESNEARRALLSLLEDQKRAEEAVRRSEEKFAAAFRTSPYALTITRAEDGRFLEVNDAFTTISGHAREEAMASSSIALGIWAEAADRKAVLGVLQRGGAVLDREFAFRRKNGEVFTGLFSAQTIMVHGEPCVLSSTVDITDRKRAERERQSLQERLAQVEKMETIGRLAGGIAHDFNNLLMGIMSYVDLCRDGVGDDHPVRGYLDEIVRDAQRSADLTRRLLAFARQQPIAPRVIDLNAAIPRTLEMLRRLLGESVNLVWEPGSGAMTIRIDGSQLDQILVNLVVNARDAARGEGKMILRTRGIEVDAGNAQRLDVASGEYVELTAADDGIGMTHETLEHLFEPFYTTKEASGGTGLGLATVYGIVRQNGGAIEVASEWGGGSVFRIALPRSTEREADPDEGAAAVSRVPGAEGILIVEDEKSIRVTLTKFLEDLGYAVWTAESAESALRFALPPGERVDLLITDVVMPGMSGRALAERLSQTWPAMHCLFISGYPAEIITHRGVLEEGVDFLAKPFTRDELASKVRQILDR